MHYIRLFLQLQDRGYGELLLLEFRHDSESDWYEVRISHGKHEIAYAHGYANQGWNPQVNNIWVAERDRRRGIGTRIICSVETYFGQRPFPGTPITKNPAARAFWESVLNGTGSGKADGSRSARLVTAEQSPRYTDW